MTRVTLAIAMTAVLLFATFGCAPMPAGSQTPAAPAPRVTFALIGDLGYTLEEQPGVEHLFAELNRTPALAFVVHVGDLSAPRFSCTDEVVAQWLARFRASAHPVIYTPGDNDWTDCHEPAVTGTNPLTRLAKIRTVFFAGDRALGQRTLALTRQSADPAF